MGKKPVSSALNHNQQDSFQESLYPVFLKLHDRCCVIAGGGRVAGRKIDALLECGARVTVVSPEAVEHIKQLAAQGRIRWQRTTFTDKALDGSFLVFAATDDAAENSRIAALCRRRGLPVNCADEPGWCDFFVPAVLRRRSLTVAVSTGGKSPLLARQLRDAIAQFVTAHHGELLEILGEQRTRIKQAVPDAARRRRIFEALLSSDILDLLTTGSHQAVRERIKQCISSSRD